MFVNKSSLFSMIYFTEVTQRFQTAKSWRRQILLQYLLPWLYNLELVDSNLPPLNPLSSFLTKMQEVGDEFQPWLHGEGWGSAQATEMVLNNLFYITVKVCVTEILNLNARYIYKNMLFLIFTFSPFLLLKN